MWDHNNHTETESREIDSAEVCEKKQRQKCHHIFTQHRQRDIYIAT